MRFLIAIIVTLLIATLLSQALKRFPLVFYGAAILIDVLYAYGASFGISGLFWQEFIPLMQRCTLAFMLFSLVMFVGVLPDGSKTKAHLNLIRRQLSILACIFAFCHIIFYASSYLTRLFNLSSNVLFSLGLSALLVIALLVLMVTSFSQVKAHLAAASWKKVQKLAYPFYLLIYVHLLFLLAPAVLAGKDTGIISLSVYTTIVLAYVVLRLNRWRLDASAATGGVSQRGNGIALSE